MNISCFQADNRRIDFDLDYWRRKDTDCKLHSSYRKVRLVLLGLNWFSSFSTMYWTARKISGKACEKCVVCRGVLCNTFWNVANTKNFFRKNKENYQKGQATKNAVYPLKIRWEQTPRGKNKSMGILSCRQGFSSLGRPCSRALFSSSKRDRVSFFWRMFRISGVKKCPALPSEAGSLRSYGISIIHWNVREFPPFPSCGSTCLNGLFPPAPADLAGVASFLPFLIEI